MSNSAIQIELNTAGTLAAGMNVLFDSVVYSSGSIAYDSATGIITFSQAGRYVIDWWLAIYSSQIINETAFALVSSQGDYIKSSIIDNTDKVLGVGIINIITPPVTLSLVNVSTRTIYFSFLSSLKGTLVISEDDTVLTNLTDGNNTGVVRGIGTRSDCTMGLYAFAEGYETFAEVDYSHAEGSWTKASGDDSHAEGILTEGDGSHAEGYYTSTNMYYGAHIMGKYGEANVGYSWFLANGIDLDTKGLAVKILNNGNAYIELAWNADGADYAELFETADSKTLEPGYFVTFDGAGQKIRKTATSDSYVLGIVTATSGIVGDSGELRWKGKYLTDEWGRIQYHKVTVPEKKDDNGNTAHTQSQVG